MFKKPIKVQGNTKLKKAILKKVRVQSGKSLKLFDDLSDDEIHKLIPSRADFFEISRLKGIRTSFYSYNNVPVLIDTNGKGNIIPTIFGMWLVPSQLLTLQIDNGAFPHILNGAELMGPGLQYKVNEIPDFEENEPVAIALPCKKVVAIGFTLVNSKQLKTNDKKGKAVHIEHILGDHLFLHAWTTSPSPLCNIPEELEYLKPELNLPARADVIEEEQEDDNPNGEDGDNKEDENNDTDNKQENNDNNDNNDVEEEEEEEEEIPRVKISMDELLKLSFLQGLKASINENDLPIVGSVFYSLHMQPNRPRGSKIDIKRSGYKKLAKFLQAMAREDIIKIKPLPKGEIQILSINNKNKTFSEYEPYKVKSNKKENTSNTNTKKGNSDKPFTITKLLKPNGDLYPLFVSVNDQADKNDLYTRKEATEILWNYVSKENLSQQGTKQVKIDSIISRGVFRKQKKPDEIVTKEQLGTKFIAVLQENFEINREGVTKVVKGKLEPIVSKEERRGGHKYVTRVKGLETFLLTPKDIAKELRKKFAASTTVNDLVNSKSKGNTVYQEVIIQGKMNHQVKDYLCKKHYIPAGSIELTGK